MNMPSAGRAKFADCNVYEDKKVISKQLSKLCVPKLRRAAQGAAHEKELLEPNADAAHDENELPKTRRSCGEKELRRELSTQSVLGEWFSEPYEEVDVVGQRKSFASTPVTLLGQVSP